ncbi:hypothetical protein LXM94_15290 [Rhizobium sp. TRM95111]|uniref:hypothetical protein n=1 Tax=Rhizobium alarense TaxID=2846851 RepID=UPI001F22D7AF|nr:hypothetical protein [Rhizobium alarense]MCF3641338.1 hypothetical protein [Rhizobium alarense]
MQSIRSLFLTVAGVLFAGAVFLFAASLGLALAGITAVLMFGSWVAARMQPRPVRATVDARNRRQAPREPRVWNDGRGTIIDL